MSDTLSATHTHSHDNDTDRLQHAIEHAAHLLPAQGPITVFIHHNTLHAFEDLPFFEAVERGAKTFGCEPYLSEQRFRDAMAKGRIRLADIHSCLKDELNSRGDERLGNLCTRFELLMAMLEFPLRTGSDGEIDWFLAETDALRKSSGHASAANRMNLVAETRRWVMRDLRGSKAHRITWLPELLVRFKGTEIERWDDETWEAFSLQSLWQVCRAGVADVPDERPRPVPPIRHRDLLLAATGMDTDLRVHEVLIRVCAAFLDQGVSHWPLPERDKGLFHSFCTIFRQGGSPERWLNQLAPELARLQDSHVAPVDSIRESLAALGVAPDEWDDYLSRTFLVLRGWAGMLREIGNRPDRVAHPIPANSLVEFVAVRLLLDRFVLADAAREGLGYSGPLDRLRDDLRNRFPTDLVPITKPRAFYVFQIAQILGWCPHHLHEVPNETWINLVREIESFDAVQRRRMLHLAYEKRFRHQTLDALALHPPFKPPQPNWPRFQVVTCIDEREESFRRSIEEVAPDCQTFGAAGFFAVAMYYRGAADAHYIPLCPVVIRPQHWVEERVDDHLAGTNQRVRRFRRALGRASHQIHVGSRTFAFGAVLSAGLGVLASLPLVARVLFPGLAARIRRRAGRFVSAPKGTRLQLERKAATPGSEGESIGYTIEEMTNIGERILRDIGLIDGFSRMVCFLGHGSHSMNNPHESAHDCGACGGAVGGPNGRAIAQILNDPRVRQGLAARGLVIPNETWFIGGLHNTCNEYAKFADTDLIPESHHGLYDEVHDTIEAALDHNAHERARRFDSAPLNINFDGARQHMDARAEDLAQVRPEWGHATNAICIVGRRSRTRGIFFDRRAFLTSYDPTQDGPDAPILTRTLGAVFPVCGGISLEYYFSHVDPAGYGCGTKLPHNITSLLGVMDGAASDLRTGLPWQMVEIHEPVRLMIICEVKADVMMGVLQRNKMIMDMTVKGWVQLAVLDPDSQEIRVFHNGAFEVYEPETTTRFRAPSSLEWYRGARDFLDFAEIGPEPSAVG